MNSYYLSSLNRHNEGSAFRQPIRSPSKAEAPRRSLPFKKRKFEDLGREKQSAFCHDVVSSPSALTLASVAKSLRQMEDSTSSCAFAPTNNNLSLYNTFAATTTPEKSRSPLSNTTAGMLSSAASSSTKISIAESVKRGSRGSSFKPLPGECHGRTSRENTYCKLQSGYKNSVYCKIHYKQLVVRKGLLLDGSDATSLIATNDPVTSPVPFQPLDNPNIESSRQNKRYGGQEGEVRCAATTTRGRKCAYVCVLDTKYCYLHADYDNNPPPSRKSSISNRSAKSSEDDPHEASATMASFPVSEVSIASDNRTAAADTIRVSSVLHSLDEYRQNTTVTSSSSASSQRKTARRQYDSDHLLLSMISTSLWYNKEVKVAAGPYIDRIGVVKKWGNGWVSVNIPDVGLHNRRSFELYIVPTDECGKEVSNKAFKTATAASTSSRQMSDAALMRCVSRDAVSPSPASDMMNIKPGFANSDCSVSDSSTKDSVWAESMMSPHSFNNSHTFDRSTTPHQLGVEYSGCSSSARVTPGAVKKTWHKDTVALTDCLQIPRRSSTRGLELRDVSEGHYHYQRVPKKTEK